MGHPTFCSLVADAQLFVQAGEEGGEVEVDGGVGDGEVRGIGFVQTGGVEGVGDAADGVDEPEVGDAHGEVVGEDELGAGEAVFGREYLDADVRRSSSNLFMWGIGVKDSYIADADAGWRDADTLLDDGVGLPYVFVDGEEGRDKALNLAVLVLAHVTLHDLAIDEVDIGLIAGAKVLVDGDQGGGGRHGMPLTRLCYETPRRMAAGRLEAMKILAAGFAGVVLLGLVGCHSHYVEADVVNASGAAVSLVEVDYPSASFGVESLGAGATYHYRFKILGDGATKVIWTDAARKENTVGGPVLKEGQEGGLTVRIEGGTAVWTTALRP